MPTSDSSKPGYLRLLAFFFLWSIGTTAAVILSSPLSDALPDPISIPISDWLPESLASLAFPLKMSLFEALTLGIPLGLFQSLAWWAYPSKIGRTFLWVLATFVGSWAMFGFFLALRFSNPQALWFVPALSLALVQWMFLQSRFRFSFVWFPATLIGVDLAYLVSSSIRDLDLAEVRTFDGEVLGALLPWFGPVATGMVLGIVTGLAALVLKPLEKPESVSAPAESEPQKADRPRRRKRKKSG